MLANGQAIVSRQFDDHWTRLAGQFRRRQLQSNDPILLQQQLLSSKFSDVMLAFTLATETAPNYVSLRLELEARILAGENSQQLSERTGFRISTLEAYSQLFFDVRDRLLRKSFILHFVIGKDGGYKVDPGAYGTLWKLFGYFGGPACLDALITGFEGPLALRGLNASDTLDTMISLKQRQKMLVATTTLPINITTQQIIIDSWHKLRQHEQVAQSAGAQKNTLLANLDVMFDGFSPFAAGRVPSKLTSERAKIVATYETQAELRGDELLRIGLGQELPSNHVALLQEMTFPEPT